MPASRYQIIFDSRQLPPDEHDHLKERLGSRLGLDGAALARLFGGRPVVIRRHLGEDQARRLAQGLRDLGAPCRIVAQPATRLSDSVVVCPKCRHRQSPAEECHRCGLIFSKYRPGQAPSPARVDPVAAPAASPPEPTLPKPRAHDPAAQEKPSLTGATVLEAIQALKRRLEAPLRRRGAAEARGRPAYLQAVFGQLLRAMVTSAVALVFLVVGMWVARGLWMLYIATQVGERYLAQFPQEARAIVMMLDQHSLVLPLAAIVVTLLVCAAVGTAAQFLHLSRYLYHHHPWWWRLLLWHLPLAAACGWGLHHIGLVPSLKLGGALALLPTLCLAPVAFDLGRTLICELGDLLTRVRLLMHLPAGTSGWRPQLERARARIASLVNR